MSNSTNLNKLNAVLQTLWNLEINELDLGKAHTLTLVMNDLRQIQKEMVVEREKRIEREQKEALGQIADWVRGQSWVRGGER